MCFVKAAASNCLPSGKLPLELMRKSVPRSAIALIGVNMRVRLPFNQPMPLLCSPVLPFHPCTLQVNTSTDLTLVTVYLMIMLIVAFVMIMLMISNIGIGVVPKFQTAVD